MIVDRKLNSRNQLSTITYQLPFPLRFGQKLLLDAKVGIFWEEYLGGENFARREVAGGNGSFIFDMLVRIDQDGARFFSDDMVLGPFG